MSKTKIQALAEIGDTKSLVAIAEDYKEKGIDDLVTASEYKYSNEDLYDHFCHAADKKFESAAKYYKKAGELSDADALYKLGSLYQYELDDLFLAKEAYQQAAEMGHELSAVSAKSIKNSDIIAETLGLAFGLGIPIFFVAMFITSLMHAAHPLLLSFLVVFLWDSFFVATECIKSLKIGCLTWIGILIAVIATYLKFR